MWIRGIAVLLLSSIVVLTAALMGMWLDGSSTWVLLLACIGYVAFILGVMNPLYRKILGEDCECE